MLNYLLQIHISYACTYQTTFLGNGTIKNKWLVYRKSEPIDYIEETQKVLVPLIWSEVLYSVFPEIEEDKAANYSIIIKQTFELLHQINCSPKLSNSGLDAKQRIVPEAIKKIMQHKNYQFKFVISNEEDVQELFRDFVVPFSIPLKNVVCMPGLDSQTDFHERTQFVLEMAKKYKFRGLTRLHQFRKVEQNILQDPIIRENKAEYPINGHIIPRIISQTTTDTTKMYKDPNDPNNINKLWALLNIDINYSKLQIEIVLSLFLLQIFAWKMSLMYHNSSRKGL